MQIYVALFQNKLLKCRFGVQCKFFCQKLLINHLRIAIDLQLKTKDSKQNRTSSQSNLLLM